MPEGTLSVMLKLISGVGSDVWVWFAGDVILTTGGITSCPTKNVVSVKFTLLLVSLAIKVTLYWPIKAGIVNELLYQLLVLIKVNCWTVPLGMVTLAKTVSTPTLSVTFAPISIVSLTL